MGWLSRLTAVALAVLATAAGHVSVCASWKPTPEARMACCTAASTCPLRSRGATSHRTPHHVSQTDADACCAVSDRREAPPTAAYALPAAAVVAVAVIPAFEPPLPGARSVRPDESPPPRPAISRHLLLTVLLV
jgi:hypothetical protein